MLDLTYKQAGGAPAQPATTHFHLAREGGRQVLLQQLVRAVQQVRTSQPAFDKIKLELSWGRELFYNSVWEGQHSCPVPEASLDMPAWQVGPMMMMMCCVSAEAAAR